jgi:hypothetical protein
MTRRAATGDGRDRGISGEAASPEACLDGVSPEPLLALIALYRDRFLRDPRLANLVVTGACSWPPEDGIEWLYNAAVDLVRDRRDGAALRLPPAGLFAVEQAIAARDALAVLANDEDDRRQAEERLFDDGPNVRL